MPKHRSPLDTVYPRSKRAPFRGSEKKNLVVVPMWNPSHGKEDVQRGTSSAAAEGGGETITKLSDGTKYFTEALLPGHAGGVTASESHVYGISSKYYIPKCF